MSVEPGESALSTRKLLFESVGFNCISAASANQCLRLLDKHTVDAVVLDVDLDDMDPKDLIARIQTISPDIPFFGIAHHGWVPHELRGKFVAVFQKLADPKELTEELARHFSRVVTGKAV